MKNNLFEYSLLDLYDVTNGLNKSKGEFGHGHPFLTFKEVFSDFFLPDSLTSLVNSTDKEQEKCSIRAGDLFVTRTSEKADELGFSCVALKDYPKATFNGFTKRLRPKEDAPIDAKFMAFYMRSSTLRAQFEAFVNMSTRASLNNEMLAQVRVTLPSLEIQKKNASLLFALNEKIKINSEMNEMLEEMARALFRDWFIDFGPARRQMEGATDPTTIMGQAFPPEKAAELAPLFPATLGDNGLPEGWNKTPVGELSEIVGGGTPNTKADEFWVDGTHLWATPRDLSKLSGVFIRETERQLTDAGLAKVSSGLSPKGSVLMSSRAPIGYIAIASEPVAVNQGFIVLRPTQEFPTYYAKLWCEANMGTIEANANGSTFQEISKKNFKPILATVPSVNVMTKFSELAGALFAKIKANEEENKTLAEMRDLLLPKLMSGEIRLNGAEENQ